MSGFFRLKFNRPAQRNNNIEDRRDYGQDEATTYNEDYLHNFSWMGRPFRSWIFMGFLGRKVTLVRLRQCHPYVIYWLAIYSYVYFRSKRVDRSACGRA